MNGFDLIIGGGGYNLVAECRSYGKKALFRAFPRPFDDQAKRIQSHEIFYDYTSPKALQKQIETQLQSSTPHAEKKCFGANTIAQKIYEVLS